MLLEILNTVVFDSIQTEKDKLWVLGKLNQILNDQGKWSIKILENTHPCINDQDVN